MTLRTWDTTPISIDGPQGWENTRMAVRGEKYCPWWLTFLNPATGQVFDYGKPCGSFTHRECAEKKIEGLLDHIGTYILRSREEFWVATGQYDGGLAGRMRVRRHKAKTDTGATVSAFWVRRATGAVYYFANAELSGKSEPQAGMWTSAESAFVVAKAALTLPGVGDHRGINGYNFSEGWKPGIPTRRSGGLIRLTQQRPASTRIAAEAARRLGSGPPTPVLGGSGWEKPPGVPISAWVRMVGAIGREIEAERG